MNFGTYDDSPRFVFAVLRKHPYLTVSILLHVLGLGLFYYFGNYTVELKRQEAEVQASVRAASHSRTEARVHDMEKIKSLLEKSSPSKAAGAGDTDTDDDVQFSATSLPKPPKELLQEARTLSKSIDEIARDIKAEELAKALNIPKEKALEQMAPPPAEPEAAAAELPADPAQVAEEIKKLEAKARDALLQRQKDLERQEQGVSVTSDAGSASASPSAASGTSGSGDDGGGNMASANGGKGMGAGASANGGKGSGAGDGQAGNGPGAGGKGGIRGQIRAFINRDIAIPTNSKGYYGWDGEMFDRGIGRMPALESARPVTGMGRMVGADGQFASRVFVNTWYLIGPFEGKHGRDMFNTPHYPPEQAVLLDAVYEGKGKRLLKWKYVKADSYPLIPADNAEDSVYYGYTELMMDEAVDLTMLIGADDDAQVWLNDRMVWEGGNVNKLWFFHEIYDTQNSYKHDFNLNEGSRRVHFKKGRNKVFFKLSNGPSRTFFSMVLTK